MIKPKIVGTIGPRTNNPEMLRKLYNAGMRIARLNGSHADLSWHKQTIDLIRETLPDVPIIFDIPGRKIRTIQLKYEPSFCMGDNIILTTDTSQDGQYKVPVNYANLHEELNVGNTIFADDGTLRFTVNKVEGRDIHCRAETDGVLKSRKGINVPFVSLKTPLITDSDVKILKFVCENNIDYIGISFVESAMHIQEIKKLLCNSWPRIVAKIENQRGIDNLEEIVNQADVIMIDRGDLSVETSLTTMAISQKKIIQMARKFGVPVILATEMLHTMINNSFPTKAEITDITNAILDGASATMLSGETAVGDYPIEAVQLMNHVSSAAVDYLHETNENLDRKAYTRAIEDAAVSICNSMPITKIVIVTKTGYAARIIASRRLKQPIIAVTNDAMTARSFNLFYGTEGVYVDIPFLQMSTDHISHCLKKLWELKKINDQDQILVVAVAYPKTGNLMNLLQTHSVYDLRCSLGWDMLEESLQHKNIQLEVNLVG